MTSHPSHPPRPAALAGRFYPADPAALSALVEGFLVPDVQPVTASAAIAPHAGLIYSGGVAGQVLSHVEITDTVIILCPKHTRLGDHTSLLTSGEWIMPGGRLSIDEALAQHLFDRLPGVTDDPLAHAQEHAIEVLLPFLLALRPDVRFVPIAMGFRDLASCEALGQALGEALADWDERVLLLCSSDMNHFEDQATTLRKDQLAIDRILAFDPIGLYETCRRHTISMCGVVPTTVAMIALQQEPASQPSPTLIAHTTSAAVSGDEQRVVGYAGVVM